MISPARKIHTFEDLDDGIKDYIQELNDLRYVTYMSCSGMKGDHHEGEICPFLCFCPLKLADEELVKYYRFLGDCFFNSNWFVEYLADFVIGYLPYGLSDAIIKERFERLIRNLKMRDFFKNSYY